MLHATIMAGGTGTRFWPESRAARPKQFLRLFGGRTMLRATFERLSGLIPPERGLGATTAPLADRTAAELPELDRRAILVEPLRRDTAPCLALAALNLVRRDPDATMLVLPADHVIAPIDAFHRAVRRAAELVERQPRALVTFGVAPSDPAESFGYIEAGEPLDASPPGAPPAAPAAREPLEGAAPPRALAALRFIEKPDAETARRLIASGRHYWNSGMFVWKARRLIELVRQHCPAIAAGCDRIAEALGTAGEAEVLRREFEAMPSISIDYAVMERAEGVVMIEAPFAWDDVGSWQAVARRQGADADGNTIDAKHLGLDTRGTIVRGGDDHLIVTVGLEDCLVIHTPDATLVARRRDEQSLRKVVAMLAERGWTEYL